IPPNHTVNRKKESPPFSLTGIDVEVLRAITARIIPADMTPGATTLDILEAFEAPLARSSTLRDVYSASMRDLVAAARTQFGRPFTEATVEQQDQLLRAIETTPFFRSVRFSHIVALY